MAKFDVIMGNVDYELDKNKVVELFHQLQKVSKSIVRCSKILWEEMDGEKSEVYDVQKLGEDLEKNAMAAFIVSDWDGRYMMDVPKILDVTRDADIIWSYSCEINSEYGLGNDYVAALAMKLREYANTATDITAKIRKTVEPFI